MPRPLVLLDLPVEMLSLLCVALGSTCGGIVAQTCLRLTCNQLYACLSLYLSDNGRVRLCLAHLATYVHSVRHRPLYVFELSSRRVVTLSWDKRLLKYEFENNPSPRCRLFLPDGMLVWYLDTFHCVGLFDSTDADKWIRCMTSVKELRKLCDDQQTLRLISAPESKVVASRRKIEFQPSWQTTWTTVLTHLNAPTNHSIAELELDANGFEGIPSLSVSDLLPVLSRLHTLKLQAIPLDSPSSIFRNAKDIVHLDLSGSVDHADGLRCLQIGLMLREWRSHSSHDRKVLVMDNVVFDPRYVSRVVAGAWDKDTGLLCAESESSVTVTYDEDAPLVYVSLSRVLWDTWMTAIDEVYNSPKDLLDVRVKLTYRSDSSSDLGASATASPVLALKKSKKAKLLGPTASSLIVPSSSPAPSFIIASVEGYSNATRERDRYMIQWYDFPCKSCGCIWRKNAITVSFRQTAVSECFKSKKACSVRPEYTRMQNGELWITDRHMPGNGGTDLTPSAAEIVAAEAHGLLVAVDPNSKEARLYFTPLEKLGAKAPASWPAGVPAPV